MSMCTAVGTLFPARNERNARLRALQNKTGAHAPCGMCARFPHSLLVTEGLKLAIPMSGVAGLQLPQDLLSKCPTVSSNLSKQCLQIVKTTRVDVIA
jgi:hypothetical protein